MQKFLLRVDGPDNEKIEIELHGLPHLEIGRPLHFVSHSGAGDKQLDFDGNIETMDQFFDLDPSEPNSDVRHKHPLKVCITHISLKKKGN
jgi:hypothetical protein